jgi:hypothetical protein
MASPIVKKQAEFVPVLQNETNLLKIDQKNINSATIARE